MPAKPEYFDYLPTAAEVGANPIQIESIESFWRADYPDDPHLRELHILRTFMAIKDGYCTMAQALNPHESQTRLRQAG
ncbi:hypothetical protein BH09SUM1_BH09SUM1_04570 [soil metagenome]